jgi:hypothetical protein
MMFAASAPEAASPAAHEGTKRDETMTMIETGNISVNVNVKWPKFWLIK